MRAGQVSWSFVNKRLTIVQVLMRQMPRRASGERTGIIFQVACRRIESEPSEEKTKLDRWLARLFGVFSIPKGEWICADKWRQRASVLVWL